MICSVISGPAEEHRISTNAMDSATAEVTRGTTILRIDPQTPFVGVRTGWGEDGPVHAFSRRLPIPIMIGIGIGRGIGRTTGRGTATRRGRSTVNSGWLLSHAGRRRSSTQINGKAA